MGSAAETNPFAHIEHPIAFDRIRAEHVRPAVAALLEEAQASLSALEADASPPSYDNTLGALERMTEKLGRAMGVISHLESVATTPELREAYNEVQPKVSAFYTGIPLSSPVFRRLKEFAATPEAAALDATRARFLEKTIESFEREGAALDEADKDRLRKLNVELTELTTKFAQNVLDATNAFELVLEERARLTGLPERAIEAAAESARAKGKTGYRFTLHEPSMVPVLTYADDAALREQLYRAYYSRASAGEHENGKVVQRVLELRRAKARLLGFQHFVDLVLDERMAETGQRARSFLDDLHARSSVAFEREKAELQAFRDELEGARSKPLAPWDVGYYAEKQRTQRYAFDEEALRPYFSADSVLAGLFAIVHELYGIRVSRVHDLPAWHESVQSYRIEDADGSVLGVFYADLFPREQKRGGAWMNAFITGEPGPGGAWSPHVGLICGNLTPPPPGHGPALLTHREVQTIFHECGHLLHHMLSRVDVKSLAGTSVAWDFVELPSQIMENFCWERATLDLFGRHHQTGEAIPEDLLSRMQRARTYRGASAMMRQLGFGMVDLLLHMEYEPSVHGDLLAYSRSVLNRFSPAPLAPDHALIVSFNHLFSHPVGYAGGYYSYKWAEVLDADAFSRFRGEGLLSRAIGMEFRTKILARGDSRDPMQLFVDFMGREPDLRALLERSGIAA